MSARAVGMLLALALVSGRGAEGSSAGRTAQDAAPAAAPAAPGGPSVGRAGRVSDVIVPGPQLEVRPGNFLTPLALRITAIRPHGDRFRYDFEFFGREPGEYALSDYLRRVDGEPVDLDAAASLPRVRVGSVLEPAAVLPRDPAPGSEPSFGGYRAALLLGGLVWVGGLYALLRSRRRERIAAAPTAAAPTLADVLEPLVRMAVEGRLPAEERARLERGLVAHWTERLGLRDERPERLLSRLREHGDAGPLLRGLEEWLHRPDGAGQVDVARLLAPYRNVGGQRLEGTSFPKGVER